MARVSGSYPEHFEIECSECEPIEEDFGSPFLERVNFLS